jgi:hypothetical protein
MGLPSYSGGLFKFNQTAHTGSPKLQGFTKNALDLIRNLAGVVVLLCLADISGSKLLIFVAQIGLFLVSTHLGFLLLRHDFNPFSFIRRNLFREGLNVLATIIFTLFVFLALYQLVGTLVAEISHAQTSK